MTAGGHVKLIPAETIVWIAQPGDILAATIEGL